jgi:thioredoxin 1
MGPIVTRLATDFDGRALVGQVNVLEQGALTRSHGVNATPTFVYFKNGREVDREVGQTTYADLAGRLQALLATP